MTSSIPQRVSLVQQTADTLLNGIATGRWHDWLPGERELAADFLVGRNTVRAALRELDSSGVVEAIQGVGHRIHRRALRAAASRHRPASIGLLLPGGLHRLRLNQALWIDRLRALLIKQGLELHIHHQHRFPRDPHRHACWILVLCNATLQRRFACERIPCVVAGTPHPGIPLPSVDLNHRALCRHAIGLLVARGHRRIAFLTRAPIYAGDRESELGCVEGARLSTHADVSVQIVRHNDSREGVSKAVQRLLRSARPPTALLVADSHHCLTVASLLARSQNQDVALVCRDDDPALAHLVPAPARYAVSPAVIARHLLKLILRDDHAAPPPAVLLVPRLIPGETLSAPVPR